MNIHKATSMSQDCVRFNQLHLVSLNKKRSDIIYNNNILINGADFGSDHFLLLCKLRDRLSRESGLIVSQIVS